MLEAIVALGEGKRIGTKLGIGNAVSHSWLLVSYAVRFSAMRLWMKNGCAQFYEILS